MKQLEAYRIRKSIINYLNTSEFKKISDDMFIELLIDKKSKKAENYIRIIQDLEAEGIVIRSGNCIKLQTTMPLL